MELDGKDYAGILKYANGTRLVTDSLCNARFDPANAEYRLNGSMLEVPVRATRDLFAHDEVYLCYGRDSTFDWLDFKIYVAPR